MTAGAIAICDQVKLELLHSARDGAEFQRKLASLDALPLCASPPGLWRRVIEVYGLLAAVSPQWHRSVKHADLLIAVCAEAASVTLVHYDQDFDAIAAATGQAVRWVAPQGSL
jgi:predicted nucleic acid-binding protein